MAGLGGCSWACCSVDAGALARAVGRAVALAVLVAAEVAAVEAADSEASAGAGTSAVVEPALAGNHYDTNSRRLQQRQRLS